MPLEGLSLRKRLQHLELITQQNYFFKIWLRSSASVDLPSYKKIIINKLFTVMVTIQIYFLRTMIVWVNENYGVIN